MEFIFIAAIILFVLNYNRMIDSKKFIGDIEPYFRFLMEDDYAFLLNVKYGSEDLDINKLFSIRIRNALVIIGCFLIILMFSNLSFINVIFSIVIGYLVFKIPYMNLKAYYKSNLNKINQMLPYYLKSLEILIQHYTVPVALAKSVETAPEIFKSGLTRLIERIEAGDSTVEPYMDFAKEYPVRDSMRMMRLLYRLSLGAQENKHEQLVMFAKSVSTLQNKMREDKYKNRLETMEHKTMMMLFSTGGGILVLLMIAMMSMMGM